MGKLDINKKFKKYKTIKKSKCNLKRTKIQKGGATAQEKKDFNTIKKMTKFINQHLNEIFNMELDITKESPYAYPLQLYVNSLSQILNKFDLDTVHECEEVFKNFYKMIDILSDNKQISSLERVSFQEFYNVYLYYENLVDKKMNNIQALKQASHRSTKRNSKIPIVLANNFKNNDNNNKNGFVVLQNYLNNNTINNSRSIETYTSIYNNINFINFLAHKYKIDTTLANTTVCEKIRIILSMSNKIKQNLGYNVNIDPNMNDIIIKEELDKFKNYNYPTPYLKNYIIKQDQMFKLKFYQLYYFYYYIVINKMKPIDALDKAMTISNSQTRITDISEIVPTQNTHIAEISEISEIVPTQNTYIDEISEIVPTQNTHIDEIVPRNNSNNSRILASQNININKIINKDIYISNYKNINLINFLAHKYKISTLLTIDEFYTHLTDLIVKPKLKKIINGINDNDTLSNEIDKFRTYSMQQYKMNNTTLPIFSNFNDLYYYYYYIVIKHMKPKDALQKVLTSNNNPTRITSIHEISQLQNSNNSNNSNNNSWEMVNSNINYNSNGYKHVSVSPNTKIKL